jgi:two-component system, cell cycle response regulator DivK
MVNKLTILVVDDYLDALDVWEMYLHTEGFNVLTAADGHQALATATAALPDLIVMDLDLPGLSGVEVARELRSRVATRDVPLIAATGHSDAAQLDRARQAGFDAVIVKPCDPSTLLVEIRRLLAAPKAGPRGEPDSSAS